MHSLVPNATYVDLVSDPSEFPSIQQLITGWHDTPAFVQGRRLDVLASNTLATNLSPLFTPGENLLRAIFLVPDPASRALYGDQWESLAHSAIAGVRSSAPRSMTHCSTSSSASCGPQ